ncbi:MAG: serine/threonine-protein kinase [Pirellulales bacterium]
MPRKASTISKTDHDLIEDLLDQWEDARQRGESVRLESLCQAHPDLLDEVRARTAAIESIEFRMDGDSGEADDNQLTITSHVASLEFHAKGGLGAVFVGEDREVHRKVAVKFIHATLAGDPAARQRFSLEAEVTGRLEHPGVIPLYGVGEDSNGRLFYAMRFIDGMTLDEAIGHCFQGEHPRYDAQSVEHRRLLQSFVSVCKTIAYAHNRGIVHRDIKPENILLGRYGETIIVDWGLASPVMRDERFRQSGENTLMPRSGSSGSSSSLGAGTPAYMSPEQASELAPTPASDVYSLGATLFKILTGVPPATGESLMEIKTKIVEGRLPRPTEITSDVPRALEAICRKAMATQPSQRYLTAYELAEDLERYLADEPIQAMADPLSSKVARFARRHLLAAQVAAIGLLTCMIIVAISALWLGKLAGNERTAREDAESAQYVAEVARRDNLRSSALFLAKSVAQEIELRWRIMESEAASPRLQELMQQVNGGLLESGMPDPEVQEDIQTWLDKRYIANNSSVKTASWILNAIEGTQLARVPEAESIGASYQHRDYFHGRGRDLPPGSPETEGLRPLADKIVHMSAVYESTNTATLMVAFSVPIWSGPTEDAERQRIGILGMCVELGEFAIGRRAMLVDTRVDQLDDEPGLVLHHSELGVRGEDGNLPRLSADTLQMALSLRRDRIRPGRLFGEARSSILEGFVDPVDKAPHLAAMEPVIIHGRPANVADTGWVVVALEPADRDGR